MLGDLAVELDSFKIQHVQILHLEWKKF